MGIGRPLPEDGFNFQNNKPNGLNLGCATIHQGGIVQREVRAGELFIVGVSNAQFDRTIYRVEHKALPFSSLREALSKEVESCLEEEERLCHLVLKTGGPLPEHEKERAAPRKAAQHAQA